MIIHIVVLQHESGAVRDVEQLFSDSKVDPHIGDIHPFSCPVYVLASQLASGKTLQRWDSRAPLGVHFIKMNQLALVIQRIIDTLGLDKFGLIRTLIVSAVHKPLFVSEELC